jgi:uncharacterized membrane protein YfcA
VLIVAAAFAVGAAVGLISGLAGIGGGVLMVPFLYVLLARANVAPADVTVMAHATSLMVMVPTAVRGLMGFRGSGLVHWRTAVPLSAAAAVGAGLTARIATQLPGHTLRVAFGVFLLVVSVDLLLRTSHHDDLPDSSGRHLAGAILLGLPVGALSAALGVGGGIPATMGMHYILRMPFRAIPPTSLVLILITGLAGSVSYLLQPVAGVPFGGVVGHVDFLHGLPIAAGAVLLAPVGVRISRRVSVLWLRRIFGLILLGLGADLVLQNLL